MICMARLKALLCSMQQARGTPQLSSMACRKGSPTILWTSSYSNDPCWATRGLLNALGDCGATGDVQCSGRWNACQILRGPLGDEGSYQGRVQQACRLTAPEDIPSRVQCLGLPHIKGLHVAL